MSKVDDALTRLRASVNALREAKSAAQAADLPSDEIMALEANISALDAMIDRTYKLAMNRGSEEPVDLVKRFELDPSRIRERRTED